MPASPAPSKIQLGATFASEMEMKILFSFSSSDVNASSIAALHTAAVATAITVHTTLSHD